ncbi:hypothetical protein [uncultured Cohaesibacter sp.]|uniref:hypothetical protein n=1 Tax=uncultured Cohaesibacter sp. TaxID=1002546 RepID=UPI0029C6424B|nr:hypothetical protein [uncultured Cohaesibacter sp.]
MSDANLKIREMRPQQFRRLAVKYSSFLFIAIPTFFAIIYYGLIASDQYAVEVRFSIRGVNGVGSADLLGLVTGTTSSKSTTTDSYILMDYLVSRPFLDDMNDQINLEHLFDSSKADFLSSFDSELPIEDFMEYWEKMISISYDSTSQIIVLEFRAFTPEDATLIANTVMKQSEKLVNDLSVQERKDAVYQAEHELQDKQAYLKDIRNKIRSFREKEQIIDPNAVAQAKVESQSHLEQQIIQAKAELKSKSLFLDEDAPSLKSLRSRIEALEKQVTEERALIAEDSSDGTISALMEGYRDLLMEQEFAEKAYTTALTAVETAQLEANRRQRYLVTFVQPKQPETALYPERLLNVFLTFIISAIVWAIGVLVVYAIRDHAS